MAERWQWMLVPWRGGWNLRSKAPGQGSAAWGHGSGEERSIENPMFTTSIKRGLVKDEALFSYICL